VITVKVEAQQAIAKFSPSGIPEDVRRNLRAVIPNLTKRLGAAVDANLSAGLKTRRSITVRKEMVENRSALYGRVVTVSSKLPMLPLWLEEGTKAHDIVARNAKALYFYWDKAGGFVAFHSVHHPGFAGIHYSRDAFAEMEDEIVKKLDEADVAGAQGRIVT